MRKVAIALVSTVVGLVLLLSYKAHTGPAATVTTQADSQPDTSPPPDSPAPASPPPSNSPSAAASPSPSQPPKPAPPAVRRFTGDAIDTDYGPVQVRITMTGTRITDVAALQLPNDESRSREIASYSAPRLRAEALAAQSANIDAVSGASYTSDGYKKSLQSAIDRARA